MRGYGVGVKRWDEILDSVTANSPPSPYDLIPNKCRGILKFDLYGI